MKTTINVVLAGIGGQGVIKASDILSEAAFTAGFDIKKSEIQSLVSFSWIKSSFSN
jgi:indolepyruvate ferredoxin oxidoreductase beta subunit